MLQSRIRLRGSMPSSVDSSLSSLAAVFDALTLCSRHTPFRAQPSTTFIRYASHAAQGRANGPGDSAGRRLGAKRTASEFVVPGTIIFRQRGTLWFPGENVGMGKDHTIYATVAGYVRYYKNPAVHPKRRYIGVALDREGPRSKLPTPANAPTRRRLGMYASPIAKQTDEEFLSSHMTADSKGARAAPLPAPREKSSGAIRTPILRPGTPWESNYSIGKMAEVKAPKIKDFDRKDRWTAWRKRAKKVTEKMLARASKANRKTKGKKSNKGAGGPRKR